MAKRKPVNWEYAGRLFVYTIPNNLENDIEKAIQQVRDVYTNSIKEVLAEQPSDWAPKSREWAKRSGHDELYFGETLSFVSVITSERNTRGLRAKRGDKKVFVGARHDIKHHSGMSLRELAEILQSIPDGTRNLFYRAYERVEDRIEHIFRQVDIRLK